jgi:hypothetical protein
VFGGFSGFFFGIFFDLYANDIRKSILNEICSEEK